MKNLFLTKTRWLVTIILLTALGIGNVWGEKITDYNNIVSGTEYYIGATTSSTDYYWSSPQTTTGTGVSGTAVTSKASATIVILEGSSTSWKIKIKGTSNYVTLNSSKANGKFNIAASSNNWTFSNANNLIKMLYTGSYCLQKNNSGTQFGSYGGTQTNVWLEEAGEYTITATRNNDSYGTIEVSGTTITATPAAGYRVMAGNDGYTVTSGSATVVNNGDNTFTVTPSSDCTVRINFESKGCTDHGASSITGGALSDADHGPLHAYYDYSTSQILYTKSDLDLAAGKKGTIKSIYFEYSGDAAMAARTIKIYMANTDLSSLTTSNYVPYASFTQVYSGTFSCGSAGWYEITLDTPFDYNGAGQLAVMIDDNTNTYESSKSFKYHSATGKQIYKRQDDTDIDPASWTPASAIDYRPNTKFCIQEADMTPATVTLMDNGATITEASAGAGVTLPSRAGCAGYTFAGWTKTWVTDQTEWTTTAPTIIPAGSYTPTANENLYPVYTKEEGGGGPVSVSGGEMANGVGTTGWTTSGTGTYSGNGVKFDGANDYIQSPDLSSNSLKEVIVKYNAGHNGGSGSVLTFASLDGSGNVIDSETATPTEAYNSQSTTYSLTLSGSTVIKYVRVTMTSKRNNLGMKYCEVFASGSTTSYISVPNCCTALGTINGSISWSSTSATLTWDNIANVSGWAVTCKNTSTSAAAGSVGSITTNGAGKKTCTITDLTCGGTGYTFTISATAASGYCDKSWELTGSTTACTDPAITVSPASLSGLDYIVGSGPSAAKSFTVSGANLSANLVVSAPANYEVCKTADGTYTSTISYTPSDGAVANTTAYIRLAAGLNVGTYNYAAASGLQVTSTGAKTRTAALNGSVTKADCAITFTDFNAVDHYEATLEYGSRVTVSYNYTYNGDGSFSISHSPATGKIDKANKTLTVSAAGIWTLNASATAGTNYSKPSDASAQIRVKCVDTYKDFIHNKTIKAYGSGTAVTDGKMEDWGSGYTVPYIEDNAEETSGSCQQTHYKFMGWVSEDDINIADGTFKTGWTLIQAGTESKLATTKTYYAVWAKLEE